MIIISKRHKQIVIAIAILFLLGRIMGLHAHGHVELNHEHEADVASSHQHDNLHEKVHLVNHMNDSLNLASEHDNDHGNNTFDIKIPSIVKKQNSGFEIGLLFLLSVFLLTCFLPRSLLITGIFREARFTFSDKLYLIHQPLRAPPTLA